MKWTYLAVVATLAYVLYLHSQIHDLQNEIVMVRGFALDSTDGRHINDLESKVSHLESLAIKDGDRVKLMYCEQYYSDGTKRCRLDK